MITLVIIGVIAAMTVPTLINKTNNQEYVSKLKKAYSTLAQATNLIIMEEGTPKNGWALDMEELYGLYKKHLHSAKDCGINTGCFNQHNTTGGYKRLNGEPDGNDWNSSDARYKLILSDGTQISFLGWDGIACEGSNYGSSGACATFWVDINGEKKPNIIGRDVFRFILKENGLYPAGCDTTDNYCNGSGDSSMSRGYGCACKVLREGAMNY